MDIELASLVRSESFIFDAIALVKVMEDIKQSFDNNRWDEVLIWREVVQHKLNRSRYWREAGQINEWAIEAAEKLGKVSLMARFVHDLADINAQQGYYLRAEPLYERSFQLYENDVGDNTSATKSLHMLSLAKRALGKTQEADMLANECLNRADRFNMGPWRAHPLHLLAWLARDRADYRRAIELLNQALKIEEAHQEHDRGLMIAQTHYDIARTLIISGQPSQAETHIDQAINWSKTSGSERIGYMAMKLYGDIAYSNEQFLRAQYYYHHALDRAQTGPDERRVGEIYLDLARVYWQLGHPGKAFNYWRSGVSQLRRLGLLSMSRIWVAMLQRLRKW